MPLIRAKPCFKRRYTALTLSFPSLPHPELLLCKNVCCKTRMESVIVPANGL